MRRLGNTCSLCVVLASLTLWLGCTKSPRGGNEEAPGVETGASDRSRFDPLDLPADMNVVPQKHPRSEPLVGRIAFVETDSTRLDSTQGKASLPDEIDSLANQAYRVQIFTGKVYGAARQALRVAEEIFDRPVSLDYEVPYFKVRVGSFSSREEAEQYALRVKAAGYQDAWVVVVNVNTKASAPRYHNERPRLEVEDSLYYDETGGNGNER